MLSKYYVIIFSHKYYNTYHFTKGLSSARTGQHYNIEEIRKLYMKSQELDHGMLLNTCAIICRYKLVSLGNSAFSGY